MISIPPEHGSVERVLLKPEEAAAAMGISPRLLWQLTNEGDLPVVRIGRSVRYDPADLRAWVQSQKTRGPGEYRRPAGAGVPRHGRNPDVELKSPDRAV